MASESRGAIDSAFAWYKLGTDLASRDTAHYKKLGVIYARIAGIYIGHERFEDGIDYLLKSLEAAQLIGDTQREIQSMVEIGGAFHRADQFEEAEKYYHYGLDAARRHEEYSTLVYVLNSLGDLYRNQKMYEKAIPFHEEANQTFRKHNPDQEEFWSITSLGKIYYGLGDYQKSRVYFQSVIDNATGASNANLIAQAYLNLALLSDLEGKSEQAVIECQKARDICEQFNALSVKSYISFKLALYYEKIKNYERAFYYQKEHKILSDSVDQTKELNKLNQILFKQKEQKYLTKSAITEERLKNEKASRDKEKQLFTYIIIAAILIVVILVTYAFFILISLKKNRKQKRIIEEQTEDILESIRYAKRIQSAILPPHSVVKELLPDSFILYLPKDVVAGDFYWLQKVDDTVLFAAADCTGHGVPGAMVSVVCHNALNRAVREYGLSDPAEILNKVREIVIEQFEKSEEDVKDGMDIALCAVNGNKLTYAGAHNPLWIVREGDIFETKANKQPIGKFDGAKPFNSSTYELNDGDMVYLFSDGFVDQFGGDKGKKFKPKGLRQLVLSIQDLSLTEQHQALEKAFFEWKGELDQVDDVCMIGFKYLMV